MTNEWQFRNRPNTSRRKRCKCCRPKVVEDINHALWECKETKDLWIWVQRILPLTTTDLEQVVTLSICRALIGEPLDIHVPRKWWDALRITTLWHAWLARNEAVLEKKPEGLNATKAKILLQMKACLMAKWDKHRKRVVVGWKLQRMESCG